MSENIRTNDLLGLSPVYASAKDRVFGAILGEAIGDAIGHPIEDKWMGDATKEVSGLLKDNQFTDDTQMFCAIGEALLDSPPHLGEETFMVTLGRKFEEWRKKPLGGNHRAPGGNCMDAVRKLGVGVSWREAGGKDFKGNGTAMRSGIVGCVYWKNPEYAFRIGCLTSVCTHNNLEPILAAGTVAYLVAAQIAGRSFGQAVAEALVLCSKFNNPYIVPSYPTDVELGFEYEDQNPWKLTGSFGAAFAFGGTDLQILPILQNLQGDVIVVNDGAAVPAVAEAIFFNRRFESFADIVLNAANFADDSDTIAAISGTIAGARLGQEQIYPEWRKGIELSKYLHELAERLYAISETVHSDRIHPIDAVNMADPDVVEGLMSGISITDDGEGDFAGDEIELDPDGDLYPEDDDEEFEVEF
jgi:ADP-ribosyl-[dinitrogen reductase] hydrolase